MPLQPDLFRYLLPICLKVWRNDLLSGGSEYRGSVEEFWSAITSESRLEKNLSLDEFDAVEKFMSDSILDCIVQEHCLSFSGSQSTPYSWIYSLGCYSSLFATFPALWKQWWEMTTIGQVCSALQYLSCLLYEDSRNPIFTPWTPDGGGGPPVLWERAGSISTRGWRAGNISFLKETLTPDFVRQKLLKAVIVLTNELNTHIPLQMLSDFEAQKTLLESRLKEFPSRLEDPSICEWTWTI